MANGIVPTSKPQSNIPTYLPLIDAAKKFGMPKKLLTQMARTGKIEAVRLPSGELLVAADKGQAQTKQMIIAENYSELQGNPVTITQAAEKYDVPRSTIEKWLERKYIEIIDSDSYPMKVNEAEVSYCVDIYRNRKALGITGGVPLLNENGLPYQLKHPNLSERRKRRKTSIKNGQ